MNTTLEPSVSVLDRKALFVPTVDVPPTWAELLPLSHYPGHTAVARAYSKAVVVELVRWSQFLGKKRVYITTRDLAWRTGIDYRNLVQRVIPRLEKLHGPGIRLVSRGRPRRGDDRGAAMLWEVGP